MKKSTLLNFILPISAMLLLLAFWAVAAAILDAEIILPTPLEVGGSLLALFSDGAFYAALLGTLGRSLLSFVISLACALVFSAISGFSKPFARFFSPIVTVLRSVPTMSIILLCILFLGSDQSPVLIGFLIVFPMLYAGLLGAIRQVDPDLITMAEIYRVPLVNRIKQLYLPSILPTALVAVQSSVSLNLKVVIAAEVLAQTRESIGLAMQISKIFIDTASIFAWTVVAIVLSFLLEQLVALIRKLAFGRAYGGN